ncbi:unnamed protein product [Parajaminaea phylloscopi]
MLYIIVAVALLAARALSDNLGQCTFFLYKGCAGGTSIQDLPVNFPGYSSFRCNTDVKACYPNTCEHCEKVNAGDCANKDTVDADDKVRNFVCFLSHVN